MARSRKAKPVRLSTDDACAVLRRFGSVRARETSESNWQRPKPGGGTYSIPVARNREPLATGTLGSVIRLSGIDKRDFWRAASDRRWPPAIVTTRDGLGLTDHELTAALREPTLEQVRRWCSGEGEPAGVAASRLRALEALRTSVVRGSDRWPVWKWLREPHPTLGMRAPASALEETDDIAALTRRR